MIKKTIETKCRPNTLVLKIQTEGSDTVYIRGYDSDLVNQPNTTFFNRKKIIKGKEVLEFPMPLSPEKLVLSVQSDLGRVKSVEVKSKPIETKDKWLEVEDSKFVQAAKMVALQLGYTQPGKYDVNGWNIELLGYITNIDKVGNRVKSNTPARINRKTGQIWLAKAKMDTYTVAMRMLILLHEYAHYKLQTSDEMEADFFALELYLSLGFPKTEALYAFTKVMQGSPVSVGRAESTLDKLKGYIENYA